MKKSLLFTIVMALLCLFGNVKAQTWTIPSDAWVWTAGGTDNAWYTTENWKKPTGTREDYPGQTSINDKVYIPVITDSKQNKYPVLDATITIDAIFIESEAMLGNQYLLNANNWYTDITVPTNRWVLISSPLRGVLSGDFYTATQGGTYSGPFNPSVYAGEEGNSTSGKHNRKFPYVIYERLFSNATQIRYAAYDIDQWSPSWANPTNALATEFQPGEALQILARGKGDAGETETFHFPASDDEYYYFNSNGLITQKDGVNWKEEGLQAKRAHAANSAQPGTPVYNASSTPIHLERTVPAGQTPSTLWAIGNPAFARMSIHEFLETNVRKGHTANYLYKHVNGDGSVEEANGSELLYWYDVETSSLLAAQSVPGDPDHISVTAAPYIDRNSGFKVAAGDNTILPEYPTAILGTYNMELTAAPMDWEISEPNTTGTNESIRSINTNITITKATNSTVWISNLAGLASEIVEGVVDDSNNTITISGGTVLGTYNGWTGSGASNTNMILFGSEDNNVTPTTQLSQITDNARSNYGWIGYTINSRYASNVDASKPLVLQYTIGADGSVHLQALKCFAIYPEGFSSSQPKFFYVGTIRRSSLLFPTFTTDKFFSSTWNAFNSYSGDKPAQETTTGTTSNATTSLDVVFTPSMFTVSSAIAQNSPRKVGAQAGNTASVIATVNNQHMNTFIVRKDNANNQYNFNEDAAILGELDEEKLSLGTLAGSTRVAVNVINDTTRCQIVLTGVNGDVDLVFDNLNALGENVRLFDANDSTYTPLNGNHATTTVTFGVNDSPLRYSLVWDYTPIIAGNETLTAIDFTAFSPAKGEVKVMSNELLKGVRVYNAAGQLITSNNANANEVSFSNLLSGIYVIEAYTANGKATKKVDVK